MFYSPPPVPSEPRPQHRPQRRRSIGSGGDELACCCRSHRQQEIDPCGIAVKEVDLHIADLHAPRLLPLQDDVIPARPPVALSNRAEQTARLGGKPVNFFSCQTLQNLME